MPNPSDLPVDSEPVVSAYKWGGDRVDPASPEAIAKLAFDPGTGTTRYWLKWATSGPNRGHLYNPQAPVSQPLTNENHAYRPATQGAFELYMRFISHPHNPVNLRGAERSQ